MLRPFRITATFEGAACCAPTDRAQRRRGWIGSALPQPAHQVHDPLGDEGGLDRFERVQLLLPGPAVPAEVDLELGLRGVERKLDRAPPGDAGLDLDVEADPLRRLLPEPRQVALAVEV